MKIAKETLRLSFPVMVGYISLGIAFGILCQQQGYSMLQAFLISLSMHVGNMQPVLLTFFHTGPSLVEVVLVALTVNARQLFYGLSFLESSPAVGKKRWYMMFSLTDETYSLLCAIPDKENKGGKRLMFYISLLDQPHWIIGFVLGAIIGSPLALDTMGIDSAMMASSTIIFVEQWLVAKQHGVVYVAITAIFTSTTLFQSSNFLLPALTLLAILLVIFQDKMEKKKDTS